ncbi:sulfite dehydrogenase (cytochrome) subunit SorB [Aquimarina sp. MAR_2010_214]|uniref:monoheme cytochrome C n=1 Tax=Aquimarina sp. MAR_2010_214 TaxID=1250026 RepID=UPI000C70C8B5|nr:monoheme cytochrome C [Aquimarina sp. MAR_2010_214]PKV50643.1 sulfite dehydrogenase (cytochrome) subunit SorB [Aquimarina sp. MAR_2010_214]
MDNQTQFKQQIKTIYRFLLVVFAVVGLITVAGIYLIVDPTLSAFRKVEKESTYVTILEEEDEDLVKNGIHVRTGFIDAEGLMVVVNNCTNCHSAKLVMQNRMNQERWIATIRWMQETQNLWDLGGNEEIIVNYLVTNYPPKKKGRRAVLTNIEWYELQD